MSWDTKKSMTTPTEQAESNDNDELNVGSEQFNPLRALYAIDYRITEKTPKMLYQNLAAFESAFLKFGVWQLNKRQKSVDTAKLTMCGKSKTVSSNLESAVIRRFEPHQMAVAGTSKLKHQRNLYSHMASTEGPLALLQKCLPVTEQKPCKTRIRVYLRYKHGIGGNIEGDLVAYDKQWNLLVKNVVETWRRRKYRYGDQSISGDPVEDECSSRLQQLGIKFPLVHVKSVNRKNVEMRRNVPQLMIRGENVVLISCISNSI